MFGLENKIKTWKKKLFENIPTLQFFACICWYQLHCCWHGFPVRQTFLNTGMKVLASISPFLSMTYVRVIQKPGFRSSTMHGCSRCVDSQLLLSREEHTGHLKSRNNYHLKISIFSKMNFDFSVVPTMGEQGAVPTIQANNVLTHMIVSLCKDDITCLWPPSPV